MQNSVPVVVAVRDMLKLARTSKEIKKMVHEKSLKINGKDVKDIREPVSLFNIFHADKTYILTLTPTARFTFSPTDNKSRLCKVIGKKILKHKKTQLNLHDGSNILTEDKIAINDSVYLNFSNKITKHISFDKGKSCIIISGKYTGQKGKIISTENSTATVKLEHKSSVLEKGRIVVA